MEWQDPLTERKMIKLNEEKPLNRIFKIGKDTIAMLCNDKFLVYVAGFWSVASSINEYTESLDHIRSTRCDICAYSSVIDDMTEVISACSKGEYSKWTWERGIVKEMTLEQVNDILFGTFGYKTKIVEKK
jgi:hypothetical protein